MQNSAAIEDYLKTIYLLQTKQTPVSTTALAETLALKPASISSMLKRLAELDLVQYQAYQGVTLTPAGEKIALRVLRSHRLMELYLAEVLGLPWDQVHAEAEQWEHVLSDYVAERIAALLGHPTADPHGAPIPTATGQMPSRPAYRLSQLNIGQTATVLEVPDSDPALLRYLHSLGLRPGVRLELLAVAPFDGPFTIRLLTEPPAQPQILGRQVAQHLWFSLPAQND
jgi:DtxR family Mn-dependent transcriptional regulator